MSSPVTPALGMREVLQIRVMRRLWFAQIVSLLGDFLALFAVISVVSFRMHGTVAQVTWVQISYLLPTAFLGPIAGVFVDRWPLQRTMVASDLIRAVLTLFLFMACSLWQIYAVLMALSVVSTFFAPAQSVAIRSHVPLEGLLSANVVMQQAMFVMRIAGPAIAGFLVASFGPNICYAIDTVSFLGSAALILSVTVTRLAPSAATQQTEAKNQIHRVWIEMREGFSFVLGHPQLSFVVLALAAGLFVMGCFGPLIAVYVRENLHASSRLFGIVSAMIGIGIIAGTNVIRILSKRFSNNQIVFSGLAGIAVGVLLLASAPLVSLSIIATFLIGFAVAAVFIPSQTLIAQSTPPALLGRVGSTVMSIVLGAQLLGLLLSGELAQWIGVRQVFVLSAAMIVVLIGAGKLYLARQVATKSETLATNADAH